MYFFSMAKKGGGKSVYVPIKKILEWRIDLVKIYIELCQKTGRNGDTNLITKIVTEVNEEKKRNKDAQNALKTAATTKKERKRKNVERDADTPKKQEEFIDVIRPRDCGTEIQKDTMDSAQAKWQEKERNMFAQMQAIHKRNSDLEMRHTKMARTTKMIEDENRALREKISAKEEAIIQLKFANDNLEREKIYAAEFDMSLTKTISDYAVYLSKCMELWTTIGNTAEKLKDGGNELIRRHENSIRARNSDQTLDLSELSLQSQTHIASESSNIDPTYWNDGTTYGQPNMLQQQKDYNESFSTFSNNQQDDFSGDLLTTFMGLNTEDADDETRQVLDHLNAGAAFN